MYNVHSPVRSCSVYCTVFCAVLQSVALLCFKCTALSGQNFVCTVQGPAQSRSLLCTVLCTVLNTMHSSAISAQPSQNFVCTSLHSLVHSFSQFCAQSIVLLCYKCTAQSELCVHSLAQCCAQFYTVLCTVFCTFVL